MSYHLLRGIADPLWPTPESRFVRRPPSPVYTIFISQPSTFSSGLIFHARFFAAP